MTTKKSRRNRAPVAAALAVGALVLAACGDSADQSDTDAETDTGAGGAEEITLTYYNWATDLEAQELELIAEFEEAHPHISVQLESVATPEYWTRAEAMAASGDLPDVMYMSSGYVQEWIHDDLIINIQEYVDRDIDAEQYALGTAEDAQHPESGELYAFPYAFVHTVLYYNVDAFEEAGVPEPTEGWTWDDFLEAAQATTIGAPGSQKERYGHNFFGRYTQIESWIFNNGGHLVAEDGSIVVDDNAAEALAFLESLIHEHEVAPEPREMEGMENHEPFTRGLSAMWVDGIFALDSVRNAVADDFTWRIAPIPRGPQATEDVSYGWSDLMAISADSDHPEEAWMLIDWLTGAERPAETVEAGKIPIYMPAADDDAILQPGVQPDNQEFMLEWGEHAGPTSFTMGWGEWRGYTGGDGMEAFLDEVLNGRMSLEEAIDRTETRGNEVISRFEQ
ncbi:ABC transporter substrate-binding protein [Sanguibacter sp. Z1732]|uniref:ABC transporter substrate-binding protein n=1 Tax=Sanguibacter sp. Z1732 TaxID=3435412 RepID=UPI003D9C7EE5